VSPVSSAAPGVVGSTPRLRTQLSSGEAQLALAALNALSGPGVQSAVRSLAAVCDAHGLGREVQVATRLAQSPLTTRSAGRFCSAFKIAACHFPGIFEGARFEQRLVELAALLVTQRRIPDDFLDVAVFYVKAS
jgi:hypothetical protein